MSGWGDAPPLRWKQPSSNSKRVAQWFSKVLRAMLYYKLMIRMIRYRWQNPKRLISNA